MSEVYNATSGTGCSFFFCREFLVLYKVFKRTQNFLNQLCQIVDPRRMLTSKPIKHHPIIICCITAHVRPAMIGERQLIFLIDRIVVWYGSFWDSKPQAGLLGMSSLEYLPWVNFIGARNCF